MPVLEAPAANPESCQNLLASSRLHPFPSVALRLMSLMQQNNISLKEIGHILETDAPLSATVLRAANSPLFARFEIKSIPLALAVLGTDRVCLLTLTAAVLHTVPGSRREYLHAWWRHNLATALLAKHLSPRNEVAEYSYMCGLLHSVGQLVLFEAFPSRYEKLLAELGAANTPLLQLEREAFGADHCALGAALLKKWNVPAEMVDAAAHYFHPREASSQTTAVVHLACLAAGQIGFALSPGTVGPVDALPAEAKAILANEALRQEITERVQTIEASLG